MAQSVWKLARGWTIRASNPSGGEIFRTRPDRPWGPPSLLYSGYRVIYCYVFCHVRSSSGTKTVNFMFSHINPSKTKQRSHVTSSGCVSALISFLWPASRTIFHFEHSCTSFMTYKVKGKGIPLQAWEGSWGSRRLRLVDLLDIRHYVGGRVVTITHRVFTPRSFPGTHF